MGMEILNKAADAAGWAMANSGELAGEFAGEPADERRAATEASAAGMLPQPGPWRPVQSRALVIVDTPSGGWHSGAWLRSALSFVYGRAPA